MTQRTSDEHRVAEGAEEARQRLARRLGRARDGQREEQREEDQRHHRARSRRRRSGSQGRSDDEPRRERLRLSFRSDFIRRFGRAGWKLQCAVRREKREHAGATGMTTAATADEKQHEKNSVRPPSRPIDLMSGDRGDAGDQQRNDERDDRHADAR